MYIYATCEQILEKKHLFTCWVFFTKEFELVAGAGVKASEDRGIYDFVSIIKSYAIVVAQEGLWPTSACMTRQVQIVQVTISEESV